MPIKIITDVNVIRKIIADTSLTIYPNNITDRNLDNWNFTWTKESLYTINDTLVPLPSGLCTDNIIVYSSCGGGYGFGLFKDLFFNQSIIDHVKHEFSKLPKKYIAIQIRNTDLKCDYPSLYETNKNLIHSYEGVYIATDDRTVINFFKSKNLNVFNFTEFPDRPTHNLHDSHISSETKIKNLICDIYIIAMADKLLSKSKGSFINLVTNIRDNKQILIDKF